MVTNLSQTDNIQTRQAAERYAAAHGIKLTKTDLQKLGELEAIAANNHIQNASEENWVEWFVRHYLKFLEAIEGASDILFTLMRAVIVSFGVPAVLILLLFVEQQRVAHGIILFETNPQLATFGAWALVLLNLVLEFTIEYVEHREGFKRDNDMHFSLRIWSLKLGYMLGMDKDWTPQPKSPASTEKRLLTMVTATILILALAGSMSEIIMQAEGTWFYAIQDIALNSSLSHMVTWVGGLLFAAAAVFSAQGLSRYVAQRCIDIINSLSRTPSEGDDAQDAKDAVAVQYIMSKVNDKLKKQQQKALGHGDIVLKNGTKHYTETDWTPEAQQYPCACGCGELVDWSGIGRRTLYVSDSHRMRHKRAIQD